MVDIALDTPKTWTFWSNPIVRPKRVFEAVLLFGDLMFGGEGLNAFPPFIVQSFTRPGYNQIGYETSEYQLRSGDYAKVEYPTQAFRTTSLSVNLMDVNLGGTQGPDTAGHINAALEMMQKTYTFESDAMAHEEGATSKSYDAYINGYVNGNPQIITILELSPEGKMIGEWRIFQPLLTSATFSDIRQGTDGFGTIRLNFEYKNFAYLQGWSKRQRESRLSAASVERHNYIAEAINTAMRWLGGNGIDVSQNRVESNYR